jgi:hypothetical protein
MALQNCCLPHRFQAMFSFKLIIGSAHSFFALKSTVIIDFFRVPGKIWKLGPMLKVHHALRLFLPRRSRR